MEREMLDADRGGAPLLQARARPLAAARRRCSKREGTRLRSRSRSRQETTDAARQVHDQVPGGDPGRAAAGARARATRRSRPSTCSPCCSSRRAASSCRSCASSALPPERRARRSVNAALDKLPAVSGAAASRGAARRASWCASSRPRSARLARCKDEYISTEHLLLALAGSQGEAGDDRCSEPAPTRDAILAALQRGARPAPRHRPEPRGQVPGARALRPRPDRARRAGQARPGDRPRRGDPARDPGAVAPHQEQPRADRRARRRQDRDRRGPRAAHRLRRRARVAARPARRRARHRRADRRREVPRRVRGPAEGGAEGDPGGRRAGSSSSSTSCTRSSAPAPPRARSTPRTC